MSQVSQPISSSRVNLSDLPWLGPVLLFDSLHFIWAAMMVPYVSAEIAAPFVIGISTIQIGIYGLYTKRLSLEPLRTHFWFFAAIGFLIGSSTYTGYLAVRYLDAGTTSMLSKSGVIFSVALGLVWLRERFTAIQLAGAAIAIIGTFVIAYQSDASLQWGTFIMLAGTFAYATHFAIVKRYGGEMDFVNFLFYRMLLTAVILIILSGARGTLGLPSGAGWLAVFVTATFDVTISRAFYYTALRKIDMSLLSVITTLGPVATILWALLFFGTFPSTRQLIGGAAVLAGVLIVTGFQQRK